MKSPGSSTPLRTPLCELSPNAASSVKLRISPAAAICGDSATTRQPPPPAEPLSFDGRAVDSIMAHEQRGTSVERRSEWAPLVTTSRRLSCLHGTTIVTVLVGVLACVVAWTMDQCITALHIAHRSLRSATGMFWVDCTLWSGARMVMVLLAVFSTAKISPRAAGSGIPEMKCILAGMNLDMHMGWSTAIAKVIGLVLMCGAGMPVGREGPLVHIAGIIAMQLLKLRHFRTVSGSTVRTHEVLGAACAVGVTAAFGAPIGGVLFSIEVTTSYFLTSSYWRAFVCSVSGCAVFRLLERRGWGMESASLRMTDVILAPQVSPLCKPSSTPLSPALIVYLYLRASCFCWCCWCCRHWELPFLLSH